MINASEVSYLAVGTGAIPTSVLEELRSFAVNALDFLTPDQRIAVVGHTLTIGIGAELKKASDSAASQGKALYLPAGLWLVEANTGLSSLSGWHINVPNNKSLLVFGDGDATIIRRKATQTLVKTSALIWIKANTGINVSFQNLLIDGNEANCPTDSGFTFAGDGNTHSFPYTTTDAKTDSILAVTLIKNSVEAIQTRGGFTKSGIYPNRSIDFAVAPPSDTTVRLYDIFAHEQSANVKFISVRDQNNIPLIPNNITFDNVAMTGCVGDGFHANVQIQSLQVSNWRSFGRTRRPRADIQLSRIPLQVTNVTNFIGDAFGMEPSFTNTEHIINLSNLLVRGAFNLAGDKESFANVKATNVSHLCQFGVGQPFSNFAKVRGEFVNCSFVDTREIRKCQIKFNGGKFTIFGLKPTPTIANDIKILGNLTDDFVEFNDVEFDWAGDVTSGKFISTAGRFASVSPIAEDASPEIRFINCRTIRNLDYFASANLCRIMLFDGGQIGGKLAAVRIENSDDRLVTFITNVMLNNPERYTSALVSIASAGDVDKVRDVKAQVRITMFGSFDVERLKPISNTAIETHENITWIGGFTASVTSSPQNRIRGIPGLIMRKSEPTSGEITEWHYRNGKTYASTNYDAVVTNTVVQHIPLLQFLGNNPYNPPSLVDGSGTTTTVTVTGAIPGDFAEASFTKDLQGITVTAWVSATDIVSVRFQNETGGTVDLTQGRLRVRVTPTTGNRGPAVDPADVPPIVQL